MKNMNRKSGLRMALIAIALCGAAAVQAASGFTVTKKQKATIKVGMTRDEVRSALGRPAHNVKYRNEPGRTWTYGVPETNDMVFDVDFSADGRVLSTSQRIELVE